MLELSLPTFFYPKVVPLCWVPGGLVLRGGVPGGGQGQAPGLVHQEDREEKGEERPSLEPAP